MMVISLATLLFFYYAFAFSLLHIYIYTTYKKISSLLPLSLLSLFFSFLNYSPHFSCINNKNFFSFFTTTLFFMQKQSTNQLIDNISLKKKRALNKITFLYHTHILLFFFFFLFKIKNKRSSCNIFTIKRFFFVVNSSRVLTLFVYDKIC